MASLANPSGTTGQGLQSNAWEKDSSRKTCHDCNLKFTIRRRRHHCRRCGRLFCKKCSAERVRLETYISPFGVMKNNKEEKLRVCDSCFIAAKLILFRFLVCKVFPDCIERITQLCFFLLEFFYFFICVYICLNNHIN